MTGRSGPPLALGHYRIVSPLGAGGMGEVYLATDTRLSRNVAIKILPPSTAANDDAQRRMLREARLIATIDHPNVCTIHEIGQDEDRPYIVMQYVQGETLGQRLRRGRPALAEAIEFGRQVTSALAEAHKHGIVHRDIKPGNIMISNSGVVKVLDFGLARSFLLDPEGATEIGISRPDVVSGTTPYMSPEQLLGEHLDGRSDLFSFGVVLYEMAAGRRPFDRRTAAATINAILMGDPDPLVAPDLVELEPVILRALSKPIGRRFTDALAMQAALTEAAEAGSTGGRNLSNTSSAMWPRRTTMPSTDPAALKLYLRGRAQWNKRHPDAIRQAIGLFGEAVEIDPMHASSYAGLADAYMMLGFLQVIPPRDVIPKAKASAQRAIEIDPDLAEPHASLGYVAGMFEWDWPTASRELNEAMRLNPHYAWAPHWYGVLGGARLAEDSLRHVTRAHELEPLSPIIHTAIGINHYLRRDYHAALRVYSQVLDTEAAFAPANYYAALAYERMGDFENALTNFERSAEIAGRGGLYLGALGHCLGLSGKTDRARALLVELEERSRDRYVSPYNRMLIHLGLGEIDATLEWLEKALEDRTGNLWYTSVEARFDDIRELPAFRELVTRHGLIALEE